jgi:hypothetical protein
MSLIDKTYFINDISMSDSILDVDDFQTPIDRYEPEILKDLLGYELYTAMIADLDISGDPQTQRFIDLIDGADFTFEFNSNTITTRWNGLRNTDKVSLISYYVYFKYRQDNDSFYSSAGTQVESLTENSSRSDNWPKLVNSWNRMLEYYGTTPEFYKDSWRQYYSYYSSDWVWRDVDQFSHYNELASAYNFLLANETDYPEWVFKPIFRINQYGI